MISYEEASDIREKVVEIVLAAGFVHIKAERLFCIRSHGSKTRRVIARCHSLPKIMQKVLNAYPCYVIEVISERFDRLPEEEKTKTLIHELMHIPKSFGGGFIHHNVVNSRAVQKILQKIGNISIEKEVLK